MVLDISTSLRSNLKGQKVKVTNKTIKFVFFAHNLCEYILINYLGEPHVAVAVW